MMKKMKSITGMIATLLVAGLFTGMLAGCGSTALAENFDETTVTETAEKMIDSLNAGDYESVENYFDDDMKEAIPEDKLEEAVESTLTDAGAFTEYASAAAIGQKNKQTEEDNAVAIIVAQYENKKHTFTVSFDPDMAVNGFHMK